MNKSNKREDVVRNTSTKLDSMSELHAATFDNFKILAEYSSDAILLGVSGGNHVYANKSASEITGYSIKELTTIIGISKLAAPDELPKIKENFEKRLTGKQLSKKYETVIIHKNGTHIPIELTSAKIKWNDQTGVIVFFRDISFKENLESNQKTNEALKRKTIALEELINHFQLEREEIKKQITTNIKKMILPEFNRMKSMCAPSVVLKLIKLEADLIDICSPFLNILEKQDIHLTPREIEICQFVKNGTSSKEIAATLDIAEQTVFKQRKNIRKKLKIPANVNLVSYLKSIEFDDSLN